jgi:hypothetical protein
MALKSILAPIPDTAVDAAAAERLLHLLGGFERRFGRRLR